MKKPQFITIAVAVVLTAGIYFFGRTVPVNKKLNAGPITSEDNHSHETQASITIDTILFLAKKQLSGEQLRTVARLEEKLKQEQKGQTEEQVHSYHQLSRFWADSAGVFEPYAWYLAEAARLENSEKNLTFAARLFLDNLQQDDVIARKRWKALQAKDLFERSLKLNPLNDSAKVGIGATYLFGDISAAPMEGILKIREVVEKDSTNIYAQMMLARGSLLSGQLDKAIIRLETITRLKPAELDANLLLGEVYERMRDKKNAVIWYQKSLGLTNDNELKTEIRKRIDELKK